MEADLDEAGDCNFNVECPHCEVEIESEWFDHCDEAFGGEYYCPHCGQEV